MLFLGPISVVGAVGGAILLTRTSNAVFAAVVPWLILLACALLLVQPVVTSRVRSRRPEREQHRSPVLAVAQFLGGIYGAFFGAGLGVMMLAVLGLFIRDDLQRINALKGMMSLIINIVAALYFIALRPRVVDRRGGDAAGQRGGWLRGCVVGAPAAARGAARGGGDVRCGVRGAPAAVTPRPFVAHDLGEPLRGADGGPLAGLTVAVKDCYDIAGTRTGIGSPEWVADHAPAPVTADAVRRVLDAGATVVGKTVCDEFMYSITGANAHYGTPLNPRAPDRLPGGSSSGSASAVAGGACDLALGTDTGGSIRVPASLCGLYGLRTTHGRVGMAGIQAMAPSFDSAGWLACGPGVLRAAGSVLLGGERVRAPWSACSGYCPARCGGPADRAGGDRLPGASRRRPAARRAGGAVRGGAGGVGGVLPRRPGVRDVADVRPLDR